ncbi:MAG: cobaltochelatase subunit CobN [Pseudomonadota bacterium]
MHLLAAEAQRIDEGEEAVDLDLPPAPILILSAADGEIAAFAQAVARAPDGPQVRLASLSALTHPMSVDLLADKTLRHTKVVVVRVIGGEPFFAYGIEVLRRLALSHEITLIIVPGEPTFDEALAARGTAPLDIARALHAYCREAGPQNRDRAVAFLRHLAGEGAAPPPATAVPAAGLYANGSMAPNLAALLAVMPDGPRVALAFYRAHLMDGLTGGIDALIDALAAEGLCPVPIFVTSLKDPVAIPVVRALVGEAGPYRLLALEERAVRHLLAGDTDKGHADLNSILRDQTLTQTMFQRVVEMLLATGGSVSSDQPATGVVPGGDG